MAESQVTDQRAKPAGCKGRIGRWVVGLGIMLGVPGWLLASQGDQLMFLLDLPALLLMLGLVLGGLWLSFGPRALVVALRHAWGGAAEETAGAESLLHSALVFARMHQFCWGAGILGMLVHLALTLQNMDDPSRIGPGMAPSMLTVIYAGTLAEFVAVPLHTIVLSRLLEGPSVPTATPPTIAVPGRLAMALGAAVVCFAMSMFGLLLLALSHSG